MKKADTVTTERRAFGTELRVAKRADGVPMIAGHAAVFNRLSEDLGWFREKVAPGAFAETIEADDVRALWDHDSRLVLGRNRAGTLRLSEDATGLAVEIDPPDTQTARDLLTLIERGDISQMSFAFQVVDAGWETVAGEEIRTLRKVKLFDVSPVAFPAYPDTDVALRSLAAWKKRAGGAVTEDRQDMVEPDADGACPEGYEMSEEDGMCHLMPTEANAWRAELDIRRRRLALSEKG